jgi:hypothetical protein
MTRADHRRGWRCLRWPRGGGATETGSRAVAPHRWARRRTWRQGAANQHLAAAAGTDVDLDTGKVAEAILPSARRWCVLGRRRGEQFAAERQLGGAMAVGKEADVADAMKTAGHRVLQEPADELIGGERHHLGFAVLTIVLPGEADPAIVEPDQTRRLFAMATRWV